MISQRWIKKILKIHSLIILGLLVVGVYWPFFLLGKIPISADLMVGSYFPWLDYKWGYSVGVPVKNPIISDVFSQFFIWKTLVIDLFKQGIWPFWDPYSLSGTPLLANYQIAPLFPFNILLLLPKHFNWGLFIFAQTLVASYGMYLLIGTFIKEQQPRILGALVFSLSGLMATWLELGNAVWAMAAVPWMLYSFEVYLNTKKTLPLLLLTFSSSCLLLAGHSQISLYGSAIFISYIIYHLVILKSNWKVALVALIFWSLGVGLSAAQLFPSYDLLNDSIREHEVYIKAQNYGLTQVYELITLFSPDFFGNPTTYNHWSTISYFEAANFLGTLSLVLILPLLIFWRDKKIRFWIVLFVASIFLAVDSPITKLIYGYPIPLLTQSSASRIFFITSLAGAVLVSYGLRNLQYDDLYSRYTQRIGYLLASLLLGVLGGFLIVIVSLQSPPIDYRLVNELLVDLKVSFRNCVIPLIMLFLFLALNCNKRRKYLGLLILVLIYFDLSRYFLKFNPFVDQSLIFPTTPIIDYLRDQNNQEFFRIVSAESEVLPANTWSYYGLSSPEGYNSLALGSYARFFNRLNNESYFGNLDRYFDLTNYYPNRLSALNVKYIIAAKRDDKGVIPGDGLSYKLRELTLKKEFEDKNVVILKNPDVLSRAYFVKSVSLVNSEKELGDRLSSEEFDPRQEAVLLSDDKIADQYPTDGQVQILEYTPNKIIFQTNVNNRAFLVFADSFDKSWKLYQDEEHKTLYRVNSALRGVLVPEGKHSFEMVYYPESFYNGLKVSAISFVLIFILSIVIYRGKLIKLK